MAAPDFGPLHAAMRGFVDGRIVPGVSCALLVDGELADLHVEGCADLEAGIALRDDHLFRVFSNTKLVTACAALRLVEQGRFALDDPVGLHLPQLASMRVLRPGATRLDDSEPARRPITVRHLLSHASGLSLGLFDPGSLLFEAYAARGVRDPQRTLAQMVDALGELPLLFHPGAGWEYSMGSDVVARLLEVVTGRRFDEVLREQVLEPLAMRDTGFVVPPDQAARLAVYHAGASDIDPMQPGLTRCDDAYAGAYLRAVPRLSGGGGLVSSLPDMVRLLQALRPGAPGLLQPGTLAEAMRNQLPAGRTLQFPQWGPIPGKAFGLLGALTVEPGPEDPPHSHGTVQWGGVAGTHWWIAADGRLAGALMTQRRMAFWHPFFFALQREGYRAVERG